jgi:protease I
MTCLKPNGFANYKNWHLLISTAYFIYLYANLIIRMIKPTQNSFLIFLPKKDFNEEEFTIVRKRLLKAGKQVFITSDDHSVCSGSKGMKVKSDTSFYNVNVNNFAAIILIGGAGSRAYWKNEPLHKIIKKIFDSSPITLEKAVILINKKATCYSEDKMELISAGIDYQEKNVVVDGNVVTAENAQSALQFAEAILHLTK